MPKRENYIFNSDTLSCEVKARSGWSRFTKYLLLFFASIGMTFLYGWIYTSVLGYDLPKTAMIKKENERWLSRIDLMNRHLDEYSEILNGLQMRDDDIYRSVFGLDRIAPEVRNAGFGGVNRYSYLDGAYHSSLLKSTSMKLDVLTKKTYIQSTSFDEILSLSKRAGNIISCVPAISPVVPDKSRYRISSTFGYRSDPFTGRKTSHKGIDFAIGVGNPVYATGDGVVEKVRKSRVGYGNYVLVDHGFGYKTRYAHMNAISVEEGSVVKRGDCLGETGNTGKSSGPHLHYEVIYMGKHVNPYNYLDLTVSPEEYGSMLKNVGSDAETPVVADVQPLE